MQKEQILELADALDKLGHTDLADGVVDIYLFAGDQKEVMTKVASLDKQLSGMDLGEKQVLANEFLQNLRRRYVDPYAQKAKDVGRGVVDQAKQVGRNVVDQVKNVGQEYEANLANAEQRINQGLQPLQSELSQLVNLGQNVMNNYQSFVDYSTQVYDKYHSVITEGINSLGDKRQQQYLMSDISDLNSAMDYFRQIRGGDADIDVNEVVAKATQVAQLIGVELQEEPQFSAGTIQQDLGLEEQQPQQPQPANLFDQKNEYYKYTDNDQMAKVMEQAVSSLGIHPDQIYEAISPYVSGGQKLEDSLTPEQLKQVFNNYYGYTAASSANKLLKMADYLDIDKKYEQADAIVDMIVQKDPKSAIDKYASVNSSLKSVDPKLATRFRKEARGWWNQNVLDWLGRGNRKQTPQQQMSPQQEQAVRNSVQQGLQSPEPQGDFKGVMEQTMPNEQTMQGNQGVTTDELRERSVATGFSDAFSSIYQEFERPVSQIVDLTNMLEDSARKYADYIEDLKSKFTDYKTQTLDFYQNSPNKKVIDSIWDTVSDDIDGLAEVLTSPEIDTALVREYASRVLDNLHTMTYADKLYSKKVNRDKEIARMKRQRKGRGKAAPKAPAAVPQQPAQTMPSAQFGT